MKFDRRLLLVSVLITCLFLVSCAPRIIPRSGQPGLVDLKSNIITKEKDGIKVSVQTEEWHYPPYALIDYFTPFLFLIRNNTENKISVKYRVFFLLKGRRNKFDPFPPEGLY